MAAQFESATMSVRRIDGSVRQRPQALSAGDRDSTDMLDERSSSICSMCPDYFSCGKREIFSTSSADSFLTASTASQLKSRGSMRHIELWL